MTDTTGRAADAFTRRSVRVGEEAVAWSLAVETPVEIRFNGVPWTVMLATPADVEDLAVGLALTERRVTNRQAIEAITVSGWLGDVSVDLQVRPDGLHDDGRSRTLVGKTGCGLCGLESLAAFRARLDEDGRGNAPSEPIADGAIQAAWAALPLQQPLNKTTRSVHAAAWCRPDGEILLVREDVGRHNALDKLIGARERGPKPDAPGFVVMTSRCSYELVYKAAIARAMLLATISAPTTLALTWSETLGVPLAACGPGGQVVRFPQEVAHATG